MVARRASDCLRALDGRRARKIHIVAAAGGRPRKVTAVPGHYLRPRFSPDGRSVVFERSTGGQLTSPTWSVDPGIYLIPAAGGEARRLTERGRNPHFGASGARVYYTEDAQPAKEKEPAHEFVSVDLNGKDRRVHAKSHYATRMELSPDGRWLAFRENYHVYVTPLPPAGQVELSLEMKSLPMRRATDSGGDFPSWVDADTLTWTVGPTLYQADMPELFAEKAPADKSGAERTARSPKATASRSRSSAGTSRGQAARRRRAHRRPHRHDECCGTGDRERRDRRARQPYRGGWREGRRAEYLPRQNDSTSPAARSCPA